MASEVDGEEPDDADGADSANYERVAFIPPSVIHAVRAEVLATVMVAVARSLSDWRADPWAPVVNHLRPHCILSTQGCRGGHLSPQAAAFHQIVIQRFWMACAAESVSPRGRKSEITGRPGE